MKSNLLDRIRAAWARDHAAAQEFDLRRADHVRVATVSTPDVSGLPESVAVAHSPRTLPFILLGFLLLGASCGRLEEIEEAKRASQEAATGRARIQEEKQRRREALETAAADAERVHQAAQEASEREERSRQEAAGRAEDAARAQVAEEKKKREFPDAYQGTHGLIQVQKFAHLTGIENGVLVAPMISVWRTPDPARRLVDGIVGRAPHLSRVLIMKIDTTTDPVQVEVSYEDQDAFLGRRSGWVSEFFVSP